MGKTTFLTQVAARFSALFPGAATLVVPAWELATHERRSVEDVMRHLAARISIVSGGGEISSNSLRWGTRVPSSQVRRVLEGALERLGDARMLIALDGAESLFAARSSTPGALLSAWTGGADTPLSTRAGEQVFGMFREWSEAAAVEPLMARLQLAVATTADDVVGNPALASLVNWPAIRLGPFTAQEQQRAMACHPGAQRTLSSDELLRATEGHPVLVDALLTLAEEAPESLRRLRDEPLPAVLAEPLNRAHRPWLLERPERVRASRALLGGDDIEPTMAQHFERRGLVLGDTKRGRVHPFGEIIARWLRETCR